MSRRSGIPIPTCLTSILESALDIPLTYQKDMIVYNTDKISGYTFTGTPYFFDILSLEPAE